LSINELTLNEKFLLGFNKNLSIFSQNRDHFLSINNNRLFNSFIDKKLELEKISFDILLNIELNFENFIRNSSFVI
jgi:hypothetical protein